MGKAFEVRLQEVELSDYRRNQTVWSENPDKEIYYDVFDLSDCPEDAIIGRGLFSAIDYVNALRTGMEIAKLGYDSIEVNINVIRESEDDEAEDW